MFGKYTLPSMLKAYKDNKPLITAHFNSQTAEGANKDDTLVLGLSISAFIALLLVTLIIYGGVGFYMFNNWNTLSDTSKILAALAYMGVLGGPVIALIIVLIMKDKKTL
jgi:hypothetical protein